MVWHSYMLNPRNFLEDCIRTLKMNFWRTGLPWPVIDSCIDNHSLEYSATERAQQDYENKTGSAWDSLNDSSNVSVGCPKCKRLLECPWTTCGETQVWGDHGGESGSGFADKSFSLPCSHCGITIDHEKLRVRKFRNNMQELLLKDTPMPGTILSVHGRQT